MIKTKAKRVHKKITKHSFVVARWLARSSLPEILFISTFILMRYLNNSDFSYPSEIILPIILFALAGTVAFYTYKFVLRQVFAAHLASLPFVYMLYSFRYYNDASENAIKTVLPNNWETPVTQALLLALAMALACGLAGFILAKLIGWRNWLAGLQLPKVLVFVISFLFLVQAFKVGSRIWQIRHELSYKYPAVSAPRKPGAAATSKPDIYYIVFDRYGSDETLKNIYNYDNSDLAGFLADQGFVSRPGAYANYPYTMSSITSTLALGYHTDIGERFGSDSVTQTGFPYRAVFNNPPVAQIVKQDGYQFNQVSSWWDFTRIGIKADSHPTQGFRLRILGKEFFLSDLSRDILYKSFFLPIFQKGITAGDKALVKYDRDSNPRQNFEDQVSALKSIANRPDKSTPQLTFAHVLVPHDPYIYTADGSIPSYNNERTDTDLDETIKYTNQLTYLNKRIKDLVSTMRKASPDAAFIIQADEGPYPKEFRGELSPAHFYNPANLALPQMRQKFSAQASYYMPGIDQTTVSQNITASVNPLRFVLSHYLGYDLPPLPDCQFATGNKFQVHKYELVTERLTGRLAPADCKQYQ